MKNNEKYRYWKDEDFEIRTCIECKFSEVKCDDGEWVSYLTLEKINFIQDCFKKNIDFYNCKNCKNGLDGLDGWE